MFCHVGTSSQAMAYYAWKRFGIIDIWYKIIVKIIVNITNIAAWLYQLFLNHSCASIYIFLFIKGDGRILCFWWILWILRKFVWNTKRKFINTQPEYNFKTISTLPTSLIQKLEFFCKSLILSKAYIRMAPIYWNAKYFAGLAFTEKGLNILILSSITVII